MNAPVLISATMGGFIESVSISNILFGITVSQFYIYSQNWGRDPKWMKALAITVLLCEICYTIIAQRAQYYYSVLALDDNSILYTIDWSLRALIILEIPAEVIVRGFYMYRMWIFSNSVPLLTGMAVMTLASTGLSIAYLIEMMQAGSWGNLNKDRNFKPSMISTWVMIIGTDLLIAVTMFYSLYAYRKQSVFRRTKGIINWLMLYFISTGAVLVALSMAVVISFLVSPAKFIWAGLIVIYSRTLAISLFGALNARQAVRDRQGEVVTFGGVYRQDLSHSTKSDTALAQTELRQVQVRIAQDTVIQTDSIVMQDVPKSHREGNIVI